VSSKAASLPRIRCTACRRTFAPDREQRAFILSAKKRGMTFIALACPNCGLSTFWNPLSGSAPRLRPAVQYACPDASCDGVVCRVKAGESKPLWGCGECGRVWPVARLKRRVT
jgi:hypothetical protein